VAVEMPMFPLGSVLFPGGVAPLRLFEPRYLEMYDRVMVEGDPFAIVLIERGYEVGGSDSRFGVGTQAGLVASTTLRDGTYLVVAVGTKRVRVLEWLPDDPFPRAMVDLIEEAPCSNRGDVSRCEAGLRTMIGLLVELGVDVGDDVILSKNPVTAVFQVAQLAPIQAIDKQRVLETDDPGERAVLLHRLLEEHNEFLRLQIGGA
jgi:uncharacterized protein